MKRFHGTGPQKSEFLAAAMKQVRQANKGEQSDTLQDEA
jgi:hypothetical protein